jgi:uncharacterized protein YneF (UPF0154 family)
VLYWHEVDWILHGEKQWDSDTDSKLDFLTDHNGQTLSEKHIEVIMDSARQTWTQLHSHLLDPKSWKKAEEAKQYFNTVMKAEFPEFRYCEGDWKIEWFAAIKYPDWCRHTWDKGVRSQLYVTTPKCSLLIEYNIGQVRDYPSAAAMMRQHPQVAKERRSKSGLLHRRTLMSAILKVTQPLPFQMLRRMMLHQLHQKPTARYHLS